ncbi:MAG: hypothetical protein ACK5N8_05890 [Alphaproteobacteria bacterium]
MKKYFSINWFIVTVIAGAMLISNNGVAGCLGYIIITTIALTIVNIAKPDVIITSDSVATFSAKFWWNLGTPLILIGGIYGMFAEVINTNNLRDNYKNACSIEQIAKTGKSACETAKKELLTQLNIELPGSKESYKTAQNNIKTFSKDKDTKCSEKGLEEYGSEGCRLATEGFDKNTKEAENLKIRIENLEKELSDLKSK